MRSRRFAPGRRPATPADRPRPGDAPQRDPLVRLGEVDPAAFLAEADAPPPAAVLERIVATPVAEPPRACKRRGPKIAASAAGLAVAAVAAVFAIAPAGGGVSLAERAYAATAPADAVTYTETSWTETRDGVTVATGHVRTWQHGDRMHDVMRDVREGKVWNYEHDRNGDVFRTLMNGEFQSSGRNDPGRRGDEGVAQNLRTEVQKFRARFPRLRDAGDTTFNRRPARAYEDGDVTHYIDRETALPLGSVLALSFYERGRYDRETRKVIPTGRMVELRITTTIDRYEKLPPTPENLKLLDAPALDAAQAAAAGRQHRSG
jgi:hypothetical protein